MNSKVEFYFTKNTSWEEENRKLRKLVLDCGLTEELKWGCPCYTMGGSNIVLIHDFKDYCALLFFKGALMKDPQDILVQQTKNVQAGRQIRFTDVKEINKLLPVLKTYIKDAIAVEKSGLQVVKKATGEYDVPGEFQQRLKEDAALRSAFKALTPGRQRGYLLYFSAPKQSKTRISRIEKCTGDILNGLGLNDK